jgi:GxxExxY protein
LNAITKQIIGSAIEVHRVLGPGLLESIYENALCAELEENRIKFDRQVLVNVTYKNRRIGEYRIDLLVENDVIVALKVTEKNHEIHKAQLMTYMKLTHKKIGLIINFNNKFLKSGIKRIIL